MQQRLRPEGVRELVPLEDICDTCNLTESELSRMTGIPLSQLRQFYRGDIGLSGRERLTIFAVLAQYSPPHKETRETPCTEIEEMLSTMAEETRQERMQKALSAFRTLCAEADAEEAEEAARGVKH